jgi:hypothetical protein
MTMTDHPAPLELQYARQPPRSLASCRYRGDGGVIIIIPPVLRRRMGKVTLAVECAVILAAVLIVIGMEFGPLRSMPWIGLVPTCLAPPALAGLVVTLWMGFRWTIIEAGPEGLRLKLRGLLFTRRWFVERARIARLGSFVSIWVIGHSGLPLRHIDATDQVEDAWVMEVLTQALALPPPLPR